MAEVASARATLIAVGGRLNRLLTSLGDDGWAWRDYLLWEPMVAEVKKHADYDTELLARVHRRYSGGFVGLEREEVVETAAALDDFVRAARGAGHEDLTAEAGERLETIAATLEAVGDDAPDAAQAATIGQALGWLHDHRQDLGAVREATAGYSRPNLYVDVSERFLAAAMEQPIDETAPVVDCILGTSIRGTGRTIGRLDIDVVENPHRAAFIAMMAGTNQARTVGTNRSALICSRSTAELFGSTTFQLDDQGLSSSPVQASARVRSTITGIGSTRGGLLGRLVVRIASKKAPQQKPQADAIAQQHARQRFAQRMQQKIAAAVVDANGALAERLRAPLQRFHQFPRMMRYSSTSDALRIRVQQDAPGRLAAGAAPPEAPKSLVAVRLHESLLGNSTQGMLAGRKFDQQRIELLAESIVGRKVEALQPNPDADPFSITFADADPVTFAFRDDVVSFTIRGKGYTNADKTYGGMNVTGHYKLSDGPEGLRAERQGEFEIYPPDFVPGGAKKLGVGQIVLKRILQEKADTVEKRVTEKLNERNGRGIVLRGEPAKLGPLTVKQVRADGGWLVLGLDPDAQAVAAWGSEAEEIGGE